MKEYPGYYLDSSVVGTKQTGEIAADGSLVLTLYYQKNTDSIEPDLPKEEEITVLEKENPTLQTSDNSKISKYVTSLVISSGLCIVWKKRKNIRNTISYLRIYIETTIGK